MARNWARGRAESRGYGPKRIEQELTARGIRQSLIRDVVRETFEPPGEKEKAKILLEKRFKDKDLSEPKVLRQAAAFLQRRGYSDTVIFDLLRLSAEEA